jgi:uncharacterized protein YecE (DUF72 family)
MVEMMNWFLGTMGFGYKDWMEVFYPKACRPSNYLSYYSRRFNAVELDTTFYGVPKSSKIQQWVASVPDSFTFCAKIPRDITHEKGLIGAHGELAEFTDVMRILGHKLGVLLIQLPPRFTISEEKALGEFLELLPEDLKFAVEFRHASWERQNTEELLRQFKVCWATTEYPGLTNQVKQTCDFIYMRWIGQHGTYDRHSHERVDKTEQLTWWKENILSYKDKVKDIYGFFNNDYAGYAVGTCKKFKKILGLPIEAEEMIQGRLF